MLAAGLPRDINGDAERAWTPVFFPKDFVKHTFAILTENYSLNYDTLLEYGKQVTQIRSALRE